MNCRNCHSTICFHNDSNDSALPVHLRGKIKKWVVVLGKWLNAFIEKNIPGMANQRTVKTVTAPKVVKQDTCTVRGNVVNIYQMKETCQAAGHCLQLTQETGCNLYPVRLGWCRERIRGGYRPFYARIFLHRGVCW